MSDATHTSSLVGDITNEGKLDIVNADTSAIASIDNFGGTTTFRSGTSAGNIAISNEFQGETDFKGNSTAGNATIINVGGFSSGVTTFSNSASAGNANITNQDGSSTVFLGNSIIGWRGQQLRMDVLLHALPPAVRRAFEIAADIATIVVCVVLIVLVWPEMLAEFDQRSPAAEIPFVIPQALVPIGIGLNALLVAARLAMRTKHPC